MSVLPHDERVRDCVMIVGFLFVAAALLRPFQNTPHVDDWVYAWSVEHLRLKGHLRLLDFSAHVNVAHILWGWLFTLPFGFSFVALRWSTYALAAIGLCGLYLLLRRLDVPRREALLGAGTLGVYPIFGMLSATFMTDVPFVSVTILACYAAVTATRTHSTAWLVAAAALGSIAVAIRAVGLVLPIALCASLIVSRRAWGRQRGRWAVALAPIAVFAVLAYWSSSRIEYVAHVGVIPERLAGLRYAGELLPGMVGQTVVLLVGCVGLALVPVSLGALQKETLRRTGGFVIVLAGLLGLFFLAGVRYVLPLEAGSTWRVDGVGLTPLMVPFFSGSDSSAWLTGAALGMAVLSIASVTAVVCTRRSLAPGGPFLVWMILGHAGALAVLWLIHDRYVLVFVPLAVALLLAARPRINVPVAVGGLLLFALVSAAGVRDEVQYNAALWAAVEALERAGVPRSQVNGGYVVNGWRQYAHPEHAPRNARGDVDVPLVNGAATLPYAVGHSAPEGWIVLERFAYRRVMGPSGSVYALRADPNATESVEGRR